MNKVYDNMQGIIGNANSIMLNMASQGMFGIEYAYSAWRSEKLPYTSAFIDGLNALFERCTATDIITVRCVLS